MTTGFPNAVYPYTARVDLQDTVVANDVNSLQQEVRALETGLGVPSDGFAGGVLVSNFTSSTAFSTATTSWNTLAQRLANIENGLIYGVSVAPYVFKTGGSTITTSTSGGVGLTLTTGTGTNNLLNTPGFTLNYQGLPQVSGSNVLYVGSSEYNSILSSVTSVGALANTKVPLSTVTASGDLIYGTGSSTVGRIGIGSTGQYLTVSGGIPTWSNLPSYLPTNTLTTNGDLLTYNSGNTRLGIGSSGQVLTVVGGLPSWQTPITSYVSQTNGSVTTASTVTASSNVVRNMWVSTTTPTSGQGNEGDVWLVYV